jgi:tetratricopeptide (TPR) repeat protein
MEPVHLTERMLRGALRPEAEEELKLRVVLHLGACPCCFAVVRHLSELSGFGGMDLWFSTPAEEVGRLRQEAAPRWEELREWPLRHQHALVRLTRHFRHWGLCELLCSESVRLAASDPQAALERAEVAVSLAMAVAEWEPVEWGYVHALRAFAWAHAGNAQRVLGDLRSAERAFREADRWWEPAVREGAELGYAARLGGLKASLRRTQGKLEEAAALLDRAIPAAEPREAVTLLINRASCLDALGDLDGGLATLAAAAASEAASGRQRMCALHNRVDLLSRAGRFVEAALELPAVADLAREYGGELDCLRVVWVQARVAGGLGDGFAAKTALLVVQAEMLEAGLGYDCALVSLELAVLHLGAGETAAVKALARAIYPLFEAQDVHREALAALAVFRHAAEAEWITLEVAERLHDFLARARHRPELRLADVPGLAADRVRR